MIEVRVGKDDGVDLRWLDREFLPVPFAQLLEPLEEARVDEHSRVARVEQILRARDGACRTEERD